MSRPLIYQEIPQPTCPKPNIAEFFLLGSSKHTSSLDFKFTRDSWIALFASSWTHLSVEDAVLWLPTLDWWNFPIFVRRAWRHLGWRARTIVKRWSRWRLRCWSSVYFRFWPPRRWPKIVVGSDILGLMLLTLVRIIEFLHVLVNHFHIIFWQRAIPHWFATKLNESIASCVQTVIGYFLSLIQWTNSPNNGLRYIRYNGQIESIGSFQWPLERNNWISINQSRI